MVSGERSQLLLVTGFIVAVVVVAAAVLLNGIVVPGDVTARGSSADADRIYRSSAPLQSDLEGLFDHSSAVGDYGEPLPYADHGDLESELGDGFEWVHDRVTASGTGAITNISYLEIDSVVGDAVLQRRPLRLTGPRGSADWPVTSDAPTMPRIRVTATERRATTGLVVSGAGASPSEWRLLLRNETLRVDGPSVSRELCSSTDVGGKSVVVDVTRPTRRNATVRLAGLDEPCDEFRFGGSIDAPWTLSIEDGAATNGTYVVTTSGTSSVPEAPTTDWPRREADTVINPTFEVTYVASDLTYESTFAVYNETGR